MHKSLEQYLAAADGAARVMAHAGLLLKLSRRYETVAPAGLGHVSRVANFKSGKVVILADNGAVAAKLRQMTDSLCKLLTHGGIECIDLEIKVQPRENPYRSAASPKKTLSSASAGSLRHVAGTLPDRSPLRQALEKLADQADDPAGESN